MGPLAGAAEYRVGRPPLASRVSTLAFHVATTVLWGALYDRLRGLRRRPGRVDACTDALLLTAVAAGIDEVVRPRRFTPGADRAAEASSKWLLYGGFATGLAVGGLLALRKSSTTASTTNSTSASGDENLGRNPHRPWFPRRRPGSVEE
ncbi:hypothetical protein [Roseateles sp. YR242]|uniref:hypothetical protein n=1 Tax=Roseateles sp. YR242 TaxID=1855305 RepID=UPI001160B30C|nr:hypothetical protein [Roseateles sp. YR242]